MRSRSSGPLLPGAAIVAGLAVGLATAAGAETTAPPRAIALASPASFGRPDARSFDLKGSHARYEDGRTPGFPRTSVSHRFAEDGPVGSVGYLCGIKPFAPDAYEASRGPVSGFERGLTYLGANLAIAFR